MYQLAARSTFVLSSDSRALEALQPLKISDPQFTQFWLQKKIEESRFWPELQSHTPLVLEFLSSVPVSLKASRHLLDHKVPGNTLVPGVPARRRRWRWKEGGRPCGRG